MSEASLKKGPAWVLSTTLDAGRLNAGRLCERSEYVAHGATIFNTMLKHLGVCRAAGGEKPPKSEGGRERAPVSGETFPIIQTNQNVFLSE